MKMADAKQKRNEQLKRWIGSETDQEPPVVRRKKTRVKFDDGAVFLAACSSGDTDEVLRLLQRGADINYANVDGLTALHQASLTCEKGPLPQNETPWLSPAPTREEAHWLEWGSLLRRQAWDEALGQSPIHTFLP